jgi:citrate lyase beta subunit
MYWLIFEYRQADIQLIVSIESALAIQNLREIATADPRIAALLVSSSCMVCEEIIDVCI